MMSHRLPLFLCLSSATLVLWPLRQSECLGARGFDQQAPDPVVAVVGDERILASEVDWLFERKLAQRALSEEVEEWTRAQILQQIVNEHLVLYFLHDHDAAATEDEIHLAVEQIAERAMGVGKTLDEFLSEQKLNRRALQRNLMWQMSWGKYTSHHLTDDKLEKFFRQRQRRYDGTELRVAHLLVKVEKSQEEEAWEAALKKLQQVREEIASGDLTWEQAVTQHSDAPTAQSGGDIGWIGVEGPMPDAFNEAAFELSPGEVTQPVRTSFGVHLIKCLELRHGTVRWYAIKPALRRAVVEALFKQISDDQRKSVEVQFKGNAPYIDPQTGKLVSAEKTEAASKDKLKQ